MKLFVALSLLTTSRLHVTEAMLQQQQQIGSQRPYVFLQGLPPSSSNFLRTTGFGVFSNSDSQQQQQYSRRTTIRCMSQDLPSIEELKSDPFMKQISHSEKLVTLLGSVNDNGTAGDEDERIMSTTTNLLKAQLSHSDGIRGFFVTYLTALGDDTPADSLDVPLALTSAMMEADSSELIPLACMNVIMPTAMITMHEDEELSMQSQTTAERGLRVLQTLLSRGNTAQQCKAILAVAKGNIDGKIDDDVDVGLVEFWIEFFDKWGYKELQKRDIEQAMISLFA